MAREEITKLVVWYIGLLEKVQSAYLSLGALLVGGIHEDSSVGDGAVNIRDHGAHVTSSIGGTAILKEEGEYFHCDQ